MKEMHNFEQISSRHHKRCRLVKDRGITSVQKGKEWKPSVSFPTNQIKCTLLFMECFIIKP